MKTQNLPKPSNCVQAPGNTFSLNTLEKERTEAVRNLHNITHIEKFIFQSVISEIESNRITKSYTGQAYSTSWEGIIQAHQI